MVTINIEPTPNPATMKVLHDCRVREGGSAIAGRLLQKLKAVVIGVAIGGLFALNGAWLFAGESSTSFQTSKMQQQRETKRDNLEILVAAKPPAAEVWDVTLANSAGKPQGPFEEIEFELDGVRLQGRVPRVLIAGLAADLETLPRVQRRKVKFIKSMLPLILTVNEMIGRERKRIFVLRDLVAVGQELTSKDAKWLFETKTKMKPQGK